MNTQTQALDIRRLLTGHTTEVFKTMLSLPIMPLPSGPMPHIGERVTGSVGLGGDDVTGAVYLHLSAGLARRLAGAMLSLPAEELGESEANDVVGEITNMLTGHLKSCLCDAGVPCAVSTPSIIRGTAFAIESLPEVKREIILFQCETSPLAVEVHIKFN